MPVNRFIHFTDWVIGHSHFAMIGFASFLVLGGIAHVWQRIPGTRYNERTMNWSFWLLAVGLTLMVGDLTIAGLVEAQIWASSAPWIESVRAVASYWLVRTFSGLPILAGFILFWTSLISGPRPSAATAPAASREASEDIAAPEGYASTSHEAPSTRRFSYAHAVIFGAGVGFFALSFLVLAILPGKELEDEIERVAPVTMPTLTAAEQRGRVVYGREGCAYCHTQQIRFLADDVRRFGAPTEPWETKYEYPQLWGTRRIGPDLSREFNVRPRDWQLTHLYNPRLVVRDSMMPPFSWLFSGSPDRPTQEALDVLAYMESLGRARQLSGFERQALGSSVQTETSDMAMAGEPSARATPPTVPIAMKEGYSLSAPVLHPASDPDDLQEEVSRGGALFGANCASCHGPAGLGDGSASASLLPRPANLTAARFSDERLSSVLWNGVAGSSMPPWRQLPTEDLRALVAYIHSLHPPSAVPSTQEDMSLNEGKSLFAANCASCHGDKGAGNGPAAGALAPAPTNFHLKEPTQERAREVLEKGLPGTAMPPWTSQLSADQRLALVGFVRSLYGPQQGAPGQ
jgi:cbb3-type cytochrome oxidase cytochrome c subunit/cytochrome c553